MNIVIIHKKVKLNYHFTVPGLAEMETGLGCKIGVSQNWREHCILFFRVNMTMIVNVPQNTYIS